VELLAEEFESGTTKINLIGRLDIQGAQAVDLKFTGLAAARGGFVILDLSQLSFIASIGIRTILNNARALLHRGGRMVLYRPQPHVEKVLKVAGVDMVMGIFNDLNDARAALKGSAT
jgi:anti-sigma B factor antagonist